MEQNYLNIPEASKYAVKPHSIEHMIKKVFKKVTTWGNKRDIHNGNQNRKNPQGHNENWNHNNVLNREVIIVAYIMGSKVLGRDVPAMEIMLIIWKFVERTRTDFF